jgi:hypothetical protein
VKRPRTVHALAAAAGLTFLAVPVGVPAFAQGDAPTTTRAPRAAWAIDAIRSRCLAAVDRRFATLDELDARVTAAERVSDEQEAELHATIADTRAGLTALRTEIEGDADADAADLRADCKRIVDDHRVYVLLAPQVRLTVGADSAQSAISTLDTVIPELQAAIDAAAAGRADVTEATRLLDAMKSATAEADSLSAAVLAAVRPLTPSDYNDGSASPVLRDARADLATVARDLRSVRANARAIADLLA